MPYRTSGTVAAQLLRPLYGKHKQQQGHKTLGRQHFARRRRLRAEREHGLRPGAALSLYMGYPQRRHSVKGRHSDRKVWTYVIASQCQHRLPDSLYQPLLLARAEEPVFSHCKFWSKRRVHGQHIPSRLSAHSGIFARAIRHNGR